jgi:predicted nuclease with TOPRIM domain
LQDEEHQNKLVLKMKQLQDEYDQLKTKYSYSQNQLNEASEEKKYLLDRLKNMEKALVLSKTKCSEWQQDSCKKHKIIVGLENLL